MTSFSTLAVAAPVAHTAVAPVAQTGVAPVTVSNYVGGTGILTLLVLMVAAGMSAAGITKNTARPINQQTGHSVR